MKHELRIAAKAVARDSLNHFVRPLTSRRLKRLLNESGQARDLRIVVGGGSLSIPGWINTDISWRARYYLDLTKPWPVEAGAINRIYADNVIEHFPLEVGRVVLKNMYEALCPGGMLRLATPDVERTARLYLDGDAVGQQHLSRHRQHGYSAHHPVDLLRITFTEAGHHLGYCFDMASLRAELERAGFDDVRREEAGRSQDPAMRGLEQRANDTEKATALVVEAKKV